VMIHMNASVFSIQPTSAEPIYRQIVEQLRRLIAGGQIAPGQLLPSVRDVAGFHAINPMTVSRAYGMAEAEGLLERLRGKGMAVAAAHDKTMSQTQRMALIEELLIEVARQAKELELPAVPVLQHLGKLMGQGR
jgi:GntR family transcriptional regulator